jgi:small subunit ribosomal protein S16
VAVKIRLTRKGKKKQPTYRVVVADERSPRDGRYIEQIGRYDPRQEPSVVEIENERAEYWLSVGAQPSDAVRKLLEISGALEARPVKVKDPKVHVVDEAAQAVDAEEDEAVIEAAAVEDVVEVEDAVEVAAEVEAADSDSSEASAGEAAVDAEPDAGESVVDPAEEAVAAVADVIEDVVEEISGGDAEESAVEEESS